MDKVIKRRKDRYCEDGTTRKTYTASDEQIFINGIGTFDSSGNRLWVTRDGRSKVIRSRVWLLKAYLKTLDGGYCGLKREVFCKGIGREKIRRMITEAIYIEGGSV